VPPLAATSCFETDRMSWGWNGGKNQYHSHTCKQVKETQCVRVNLYEWTVVEANAYLNLIKINLHCERISKQKSRAHTSTPLNHLFSMFCTVGKAIIIRAYFWWRNAEDRRGTATPVWFGGKGYKAKTIKHGKTLRKRKYQPEELKSHVLFHHRTLPPVHTLSVLPVGRASPLPVKCISGRCTSVWAAYASKPLVNFSCTLWLIWDKAATGRKMWCTLLFLAVRSVLL